MHGAGGGEALPVDLWVAILIVVGCILLSAFFAGSETAMTAASRARMHGLARNGDGRAEAVNRLLDRRSRLIGAMLLGNTVVNIGASAFTTNVLTTIFGDAGVIYATIIMTIVLLIFGEVLPKTIGVNFPDRMSLVLARPVSFFVTILSPVLVVVEFVVGGVLRLVGLKAGSHSSVLSPQDELMSAVELLHSEGSVERRNRDMFGGLLELSELQVSDVMIHRTKMRTIDADQPPLDLVREVLASPYTRLPLWRDQPENIVGILHAKDLLRALAAAQGDATKLVISEIAVPPWFVPDTMSVQDQLEAFLERKTHFALVVDEYGSVMGLVTLEDILEEIVGDIRDEHDIAVQGLRQLPDGSVNVDGSVPIRDLNRVMDWDLPDEEATTVAGLVIHEARTIPEPGQTFVFHGFRFEVLRKQRNRLTALKIAPQQKLEDDSG
jgi:Mg2+/Co2+ transporter CorB